MGVQRGIDLVPRGPRVVRTPMPRERRQVAVRKPNQVLRLKEDRTDEVTVTAVHSECLEHTGAAHLEGLQENTPQAVGDDHGRQYRNAAGGGSAHDHESGGPRQLLVSEPVESEVVAQHDRAGTVTDGIEPEGPITDHGVAFSWGRAADAEALGR